jgi:hypothetical protein
VDQADYFLVIRGVHRSEHISGRIALSADDQGVFAAKLRFGMSNCLSYRRRISFVCEIYKCLILKWGKHITVPLLFVVELEQTKLTMRFSSGQLMKEGL